MDLLSQDVFPKKGNFPLTENRFWVINIWTLPRALRWLSMEKKYPNAKDWLQTWYYQVKHAQWQNFVELKDEYPSTDYVGNDRYVFNAKGNDYRLIVILKFQAQMVFIRWFGTHAEYDKLPDASAV